MLREWDTPTRDHRSAPSNGGDDGHNRRPSGHAPSRHGPRPSWRSGRPNAATAVSSERGGLSRLVASREARCRVSLRHALEPMAPLLQP
eukprot:5418005-Prymnesium_polylepis.1